MRCPVCLHTAVCDKQCLCKLEWVGAHASAYMTPGGPNVNMCVQLHVDVCEPSGQGADSWLRASCVYSWGMSLPELVRAE